MANPNEEIGTMPPLSSIPEPIELSGSQKTDFDAKMRNTTAIGKMPRRETYEKRRKEFDPQTGMLIGERANVMQERRARIRPAATEQSVKAQKEAGTYTEPEPVNQQTLSPADGFKTIEDKEAVAALQGDPTAVEEKKAELAGNPIDAESPGQLDASNQVAPTTGLPSDVVPATDADFVAPIEPVGSNAATDAEKASTSDASAQTPATSAPVESDMPVSGGSLGGSTGLPAGLSDSDPAPAESNTTDADALSDTKKRR